MAPNTSIDVNVSRRPPQTPPHRRHLSGRLDSRRPLLVAMQPLSGRLGSPQTATPNTANVATRDPAGGYLSKAWTGHYRHHLSAIGNMADVTLRALRLHQCVWQSAVSAHGQQPRPRPTWPPALPATKRRCRCRSQPPPTSMYACTIWPLLPRSSKHQVGRRGRQGTPPTTTTWADDADGAPLEQQGAISYEPPAPLANINATTKPAPTPPSARHRRGTPSGGVTATPSTPAARTMLVAVVALRLHARVVASIRVPTAQCDRPK